MTQEQTLHIAVAQYIRHQYPNILFCHVPNGGKRNPREAGKLKAMGTHAGMPDLLIFERKFHKDKTNTTGLYIELKVGKNKPDPAQLKTMQLMDSNGWKGAVCYTYETAKKLIDEYILL